MRSDTVKVCVLKTDGTNCDNETRHALCVAGASTHVVHLSTFRGGHDRFGNYDMLVVPGGFSYGDDIASGKVLGNELVTYFRDELGTFLEDKRKLLLGVCNGFQVLVQAGLLPEVRPGTMQARLALNASGHFTCKWVALEAHDSPCAFMRYIKPGTLFWLPVAHGEGGYEAPQEVLVRMREQKLVPLRYTSASNPNGSVDNIAGVCNSAGNCFGLMPHPERFIRPKDHPNWRRGYHEPLGLTLLTGGVDYIRSL